MYNSFLCVIMSYYGLNTQQGIGIQSLIKIPQFRITTSARYPHLSSLKNYCYSYEILSRLHIVTGSHAARRSTAADDR